MAESRVSEDAVRRATGRGWSEWFSELDSVGAAELGHREIVALLGERTELSAWWQQSVTVAYEQARGLRLKHQKPDGFEVSVSRTLPFRSEHVFRAWHDEEERRSWLPQPLTVRRATPARSLRITWEDGTSVDVHLSEPGAGRTRVAVQHRKLADPAAVERLREHWRAALGRLHELLGADAATGD
jgi:uncharacterized protein YndB with AHSA1/START domain